MLRTEYLLYISSVIACDRSPDPKEQTVWYWQYGPPLDKKGKAENLRTAELQAAVSS